MKQLFLLLAFTFSFVCNGQISKHDNSNIDIKDIIEINDLIYFKSDTTLVTGRIIRYIKKNKPKDYIWVTKGKPNNFGWQSINDTRITQPKESVIGSLILGAGQLLELTNTINIPTSRKSHSSDPNIDTYREYNKLFIKKVGEDASYKNRISNNMKSNEPSNLKVVPKDGPYIEYYDDKKIKSKGNYVKEKKHGAWENYNSSGNLKSKRNYIDGSKDGLWIEYYDNGKIESKVNYLKGKNEGIMEMYHLNGALKIRLNYINGKENGLMEMFHKNGQLFMKGSFKEGNEIGDWKTYDNIGRLIKKENFN